MQKQVRTALAPLFLVLAACGGGTMGVPPEATGSAPEGAASPPTSAGPVDASLRPGDAIRLQIWREPELSGDWVVNESGSVVLPKIGMVRAVDYPPGELEAHILEEYDRYLRNPSIEVILLRRINILGAVRAPGLYPVDPTMSLRDALALAGGVLTNGRQDRVDVVRGETRLSTNVTAQTRVADLGIRSGDQIYVPERTWFSRNAGLIATVTSTIITATVSLIIAFKS